MTNEDCTTLEDLFDKPRKKLVDRSNPRYCTICGCRSDNLTPHLFGKTTLYLCWMCLSVIEEPKDIIVIKEDKT